MSKFYQIRTDEDFFENEPVAGDKFYWTGKVIPKSLTVLNPELNKIAIQMNRSLLQYVGDETFSYPFSAAQAITRTALESPILANEIYLQILKNLTNNPRVTSEDRTWTLLILATQQFPPSPEFEPYLFGWLVKLKETPLLLGNFAKLCIVQLDRTIEVGPSDSVPDVDLITSYSSRPVVLLSINAGVNSCRDGDDADNANRIHVPVYPDTDVEAVVETACEIAGIRSDEVAMHGLFVTQKKTKVKSKLTERLETFHKEWDRSKLEHVEYLATM